jgi:hypothetical protein
MLETVNIPFREKFMKRESLSLQRRIEISQKLPSKFETKLTELHGSLLDCAKGISIL